MLQAMEYHASTIDNGYKILEQIPERAEDIDMDRLVWDPPYRSAVKALLIGSHRAEPETGDGPTAREPKSLKIVTRWLKEFRRGVRGRRG